MSKTLKFFFSLCLLIAFSVFGNEKVSVTPDVVSYTVDTILPEFCERHDAEQDILSMGRAIPKVLKKIVYLDNFYFYFVEVAITKNHSFSSHTFPRLRCGVKSFLHLLQLY